MNMRTSHVEGEDGRRLAHDYVLTGQDNVLRYLSCNNQPVPFRTNIVVSSSTGKGLVVVKEGSKNVVDNNSHKQAEEVEVNREEKPVVSSDDNDDCIQEPTVKEEVDSSGGSSNTATLQHQSC
jgi:hypothetical protein